MRLILIMALLMSGKTFGAEIISQAEISQLYASNSESKGINKVLAIGSNVNVPIEFSITSKGNGGFSLPGLFLIRIYDQHDDTVYFKSGLLKNELVDIDSNGYKELLLWGVAVRSDEETEKVIAEVPVVAIIKYDLESKLFKVVKKSEEIDIYSE